MTNKKEVKRDIFGRVKIDRKELNASNKKIREYFNKKLFALGFKKGERFGSNQIVRYCRTIHGVEQSVSIWVGTAWGVCYRCFCDIRTNKMDIGEKTDDIEFETTEELEALIPIFEKFIDEKLLSLDEDFYKTQITRKLNKDVYDNYIEISNNYLTENNIELNSVEDIREIANKLLKQYKDDNNNFYEYVLTVASIYIYYLSINYPEYDLKFLENEGGDLMTARPDYRDYKNVAYRTFPTKVVAAFWYYGDGPHLSVGTSVYYFNKYENKVMKKHDITEIIK